jgi:hypothetical protein
MVLYILTFTFLDSRRDDKRLSKDHLILDIRIQASCFTEARPELVPFTSFRFTAGYSDSFHVFGTPT